jgi:hypothetical protein
MIDDPAHSTVPCKVENRVITGKNHSNVQNFVHNLQRPIRTSIGGYETLYQHSPVCKHRKNRNHNDCGGPIWCQHKRERWSAGINNWDEAMGNAPSETKASKAGKNQPRPHSSPFGRANLSRYVVRITEHYLIGNAVGILSCHLEEYVPRLNVDGSLPCLQDLG